jgi:acetyl-CoA carboxylase biotin carboxyl carrier protein
MTHPHDSDPPAQDTNDASELQSLPKVVASIAETMRRNRIERLLLTKGDFHLELESRPARDEGERGLPPRAVVIEPDDADTADEAHMHIITSPMIGTYYSAPAPGEPAFVKVGDSIAQGDTIGIVEAMKIMNEIAADRAGVVAEIVAGNGETVEYGSPLVRLDLQP